MTSPGREQAEFRRRLRRGTAGLGIEISGDELAAMERHYRLLLRWNEAAGLTSITDPSEIIDRHFVESVAGASHLDHGRGTLLDIGSGNGFPALPLLVLRPSLRGTLVEATMRKWAFLKEASREAGLSERVQVVRRRVRTPEDLVALGPVDYLTARAVGGLPPLMAAASRVLAPRGRALLWVGPEVAEELRRAVPPSIHVVGRAPLPGRDRAFLLILSSEAGPRS